MFSSEDLRTSNESLICGYEYNKIDKIQCCLDEKIEKTQQEQTERCDSDNIEGNILSVVSRSFADEGNISEVKEVTNSTKNLKVKVAKFLSRVLNTMKKNVWQLLVILTVGVVIPTVINNRGETVRPAAAPQPFFSLSSPVFDFFTGDINALTEIILSKDVSVIFYYAPWDRDSQDARTEFEKVAKYFAGQVLFTSINCWQPQSDCRSRYKLTRYPAIVVHVRAPSGMETIAVGYSGHLNSGHMIRFLSRCLYPVTHVGNQAELINLQLSHSAVVLGYYNFSGSISPAGFLHFYIASLKYLQNSGGLPVAFGVVTNSAVAALFGMKTSRSVQLYLWNSTLVWPFSHVGNSENLTNWIQSKLSSTASWLHISGSKSTALDDILHLGPTLLLFTPDNPYAGSNTPYNLLRSVSLEYNNCEGSSRIQRMSSYLNSVSIQFRRHWRQVDKFCRHYLKNRFQKYQKDRVHSSSKEALCEKEQTYSSLADDTSNLQCLLPSRRSLKESLLSQIQAVFSSFSDAYKELIFSYMPWEEMEPPLSCSFNSSVDGHRKTVVGINEMKHQENNIVGGPKPDNRIKIMLDHVAEDQCKQLFLASTVGPPVHLQDFTQAQNISGWACETNRTMSFVAVDSLLHRDLAVQLGLNMSLFKPERTGAVIVDKENRIHFVLGDDLSRKSIVNFIVSFSRNYLSRKMISPSIPAANCSSGTVCVRELTAFDYKAVTHKPNQLVVVLHYRRMCVACSSALHALLATAQVFRKFHNITFARIDVAANILPWNIDFPSLPVIVLYPYSRKGETRVLDSSFRFTPAALITFIIASMPARDRFFFSSSLCPDACLSALHESCLSTAHRLQKALARLRWRRSAITRKLLAPSGLQRTKASRARMWILLHENVELGRRVVWHLDRIRHVHGLLVFIEDGFSSVMTLRDRRHVVNASKLLMRRSSKWIVHSGSSSGKFLHLWVPYRDWRQEC